MGYKLGIDLGTTWTAAAILRDGQASMVELSQRSTAMPSVVLFRENSVLVGQAADQRSAAEPSKVAREFKRRMGDSTPLLLGGTPYSAEAVTARLLGWVVEETSRQEGGPPEQLILTHPANWGEYKLDLLRQAVVLAGIDIPLQLISEPEAAAIHYASKERVEPGTVIGAYDLGGGTFDAAVLRKSVDGFEFLGQPAGIERLGGIDFDAAVFQRVISAIGIDLAELDEADQSTENALRRLRADCVIAKEVLSTDTDTSIPVLLPTMQTEVRLTRAELESMIRPTLGDTVTVTERAISSAGVPIEAIDRILLIGGSSRIPVVAELLATRFGRPLAVDAHPKNAVALGAALSAADGDMPASVIEPPIDGSGAVASSQVWVPAVTDAQPVPRAFPDSPRPSAAPTPPVAPAPALAPTPPVAPPVAPSSSTPPLAPSHPTASYPSTTSTPHAPGPVTAPYSHGDGPPAADPAGRNTTMIIGALVGLLVIVGVAAALVLGGGGDDNATTADALDAGTVNGEAVAVATNVVIATVVPPTQVVAPPVAATPTVAPTATVAPTPTTVAAVDGFYEGVRCSAVQELCIDITNVELLDGELLISWEANFVPNVADRNHAHFFWSTYSPLQAGAGGGGDWEVSDLQPHLAGSYGDAITSSRRPPSADICATVANPDHTVRDPAIYQCWRYPGQDS